MRDKKIPKGLVSLEKVDDREDPLTTYKKRKAKSFFIESNPRISQLHYYCGLNFYKQKRYRKAISHLTQALRFTKIKMKRDDKIFYMIARVFKSMVSPETMEYEKAYLDALEQAVSLNSDDLAYSREFGLALSTTRKKTKAVFHLEKYLHGDGNSQDTKILLVLAGLYESLGKYLQALRVYQNFLVLKPDNRRVLFALGNLAYSRTGNFPLAKSCFNKVLFGKGGGDEKVSLDVKAKCNEFLGDMNFSDQRYDAAERNYLSAIALLNKKYEMILKIEGTIEDKNREIDRLKSELIYDSKFNKFREYEALKDDRGRLETEFFTLKNEYKRLHGGKIHWNLAEIYIKKEQYRRAIFFFRECLRFNYKSNLARSAITKLKLKIKRGY